MGVAHGDYTFDCFTHKKAVMRRDDHTIFDIPQRYPPYNDFSLQLFRINGMLPNMPYISSNTFKLCFFTLLAVTIGNKVTGNWDFIPFSNILKKISFSISLKDGSFTFSWK